MKKIILVILAMISWSMAIIARNKRILNQLLSCLASFHDTTGKYSGLGLKVWPFLAESSSSSAITNRGQIRLFEFLFLLDLYGLKS